MPSENPNPSNLELITQHQRALYGYIYSLVFSNDIADEVLQETNIVLCRKLNEFDSNRASFLTWACKIAYFETLRIRRNASREKLASVNDSLLEELSSRALDKASSANVRLPVLRECMQELPDNQREILDRRYSSGGSVAAIADMLNRTSASVSVTLHRIRRRLHACVESKLNSQEDLR